MHLCERWVRARLNKNAFSDSILRSCRQLHCRIRGHCGLRPLFKEMYQLKFVDKVCDLKEMSHRKVFIACAVQAQVALVVGSVGKSNGDQFRFSCRRCLRS